MAKQYDNGFDYSMKAADDFSSSKFLFVKASANDTVDVCGAVTDVIVGVTQETGTTGAGVIVRFAGHTKVYLGDVVAAGALVGTDNAGKAITITAGTSTTAYIAGRCLVGGNTGAVGEIILLPSGRAS